jgi:hypothetical protein
MTNNRQRFAFVLRLAALDFRPFRSWQWEQLHDELRDFLLPTHASLRPGGVHLFPTIAPMPEEYTERDCVSLQANVRDLLQKTVVARDQGKSPPPLALPTLTFAAPPATELGGHFLHVEGSVRDLVLFGALELLTKSDLASLTRCTVCDAVFLRKKGQAYCGRSCTNYVSQQRWRERHATPDTPAVTPP